MFLSTLTLAQRLYLISGTLLAALCASAAVIWWLTSSVVAKSITADQYRAPQLSRIADVELNLTRASLMLRHAMLARNAEEMNAALADIGERRRLMEAQMEAIGKGMYTQAGRDAYAPMPAAMQEFWTIGAENIKLLQEGKKDEAFAFLVDKTIGARNRLQAPLGAEKKRQTEMLDKELDVIADEARTVRSIALAAVLLVALGMGGFAFYVVRVMRQLGAEPEALKQVAAAVAAGNLGTEIALREGDRSSIMAAMKTMRDHLAATVKAVRENADSVATASAQIANGNSDLSARTERQASALQQTASSMEQLGTTVRHNADNARQANQLAQSSSQVASNGGQVVQEVVATMRGINDSSRKIADIIGVIDGIAFQTNILALNAAVEAARAGEQGRGFAVVASEVRSLAQRSAEAAREIKALIGASVDQVEQGTALVDRAGATMQEIVQSIQRVSDIVGEITSASQEQSQGVSQVGQAVAQMDEATQQNAALVEESAAAAQSLRQQAQQLVNAVSSFKLA